MLTLRFGGRFPRRREKRCSRSGAGGRLARSRAEGAALGEQEARGHRVARLRVPQCTERAESHLRISAIFFSVMSQRSPGSCVTNCLHKSQCQWQRFVTVSLLHCL